MTEFYFWVNYHLTCPSILGLLLQGQMESLFANKCYLIAFKMFCSPPISGSC